MEYSLIENTIAELTAGAFPPPLTIEQPATMVLAKRLFSQLNSKGIFPNPQLVGRLLKENGWDDKNIKHLLKKLKKYFTSEGNIQ